MKQIEKIKFIVINLILFLLLVFLVNSLPANYITLFSILIILIAYNFGLVRIIKPKTKKNIIILFLFICILFIIMPKKITKCHGVFAEGSYCESIKCIGIPYYIIDITERIPRCIGVSWSLPEAINNSFILKPQIKQIK